MSMTKRQRKGQGRNMCEKQRVKKEQPKEQELRTNTTTAMAAKYGDLLRGDQL